MKRKKKIFYKGKFMIGKRVIKHLCVIYIIVFAGLLLGCRREAYNSWWLVLLGTLFYIYMFRIFLFTCFYFRIDSRLIYFWDIGIAPIFYKILTGVIGSFMKHQIAPIRIGSYDFLMLENLEHLENLTLVPSDLSNQ